MFVLITGVCGFIGTFTALRLLEEGCNVLGIDNLNNYYDVKLKKDRLSLLTSNPNFTFRLLDICNRSELSKLFDNNHFDAVIHLAAQAGVRYSIQDPTTYGDSNLSGFLNILEGCRKLNGAHLIYASSSSVYGQNKEVPFSVSDNVDFPISLYAATKKANELMAHAYSHLYGIPTTGLRFFTVYGPWGRPDMAYFKFVKAISGNIPIDIYNYGQMQRDFTYVDDVVEGIFRILSVIPQPNCNSHTSAPYKIYNIGNNSPVELITFIEIIERCLGIKAQKNFLPMQLGDVPRTYADIEELYTMTGFHPQTPLEEGINKFVNWFKGYYSVNRSR